MLKYGVNLDDFWNMTIKEMNIYIKIFQEKEKDKYEKMISDINSKTETVQAKDKSLELKIKQLDTEQNAITNELDAVKKVIEKNVESSFKTFG